MGKSLVASKRYSRAIESRLLSTFHTANSLELTDGKSWYSRARDIAETLGSRYGIETFQACGIIAALSPGRYWEKNIEDSETLISAYQAGARGSDLPLVGTYGRQNVVKSVAILNGSQPLDVLGGNKVRNFYSNILNPANESPVTIDRHAKCCAYGVRNADNSVVSESEYEFLAEHYRQAASTLDLVPCQFQAITWVTWRRLHSDPDAVPF
jgi:hypothetical protein